MKFLINIGVTGADIAFGLSLFANLKFLMIRYFIFSEAYGER